MDQFGNVLEFNSDFREEFEKFSVPIYFRERESIYADFLEDNLVKDLVIVQMSLKKQ